MRTWRRVASVVLQEGIRRGLGFETLDTALRRQGQVGISHRRPSESAGPGIRIERESAVIWSASADRCLPPPSGGGRKAVSLFPVDAGSRLQAGFSWWPRGRFPKPAEAGCREEMGDEGAGWPATTGWKPVASAGRLKPATRSGPATQHRRTDRKSDGRASRRTSGQNPALRIWTLAFGGRCGIVRACRCDGTASVSEVDDDGRGTQSSFLRHFFHGRQFHETRNPRAAGWVAWPSHACRQAGAARPC